MIFTKYGLLCSIEIVKLEYIINAAGCLEGPTRQVGNVRPFTWSGLFLKRCFPNNNNNNKINIAKTPEVIQWSQQTR